ncbi:MAG: DUF2075 domain-containing protein, partial [Candidatus Omnitrophica bacterium]|nr:DUF2075 domain-containing protein [Candidatus Omnitrophota bacterium]
MNRAYYSDSIANFCKTSSTEIIGLLTVNSSFSVEQTQRDAWLEEIRILQASLASLNGTIYFEYSIPRMGQRIDVVLLIGPAIFVLEFKVGEREFTAFAKDQVWDYALDLKNFHESSHNQYIAPILIATKANDILPVIATTPHNDRLLFPILCTTDLIPKVIDDVLQFIDGTDIDKVTWENGRYCPTPTIIEAALALYNQHSVNDISRNDASAINLKQTSETVSKIISLAREKSLKVICFVTGVPGAGKTLVGLNIAT